jgi:hypothetical protein
MQAKELLRALDALGSELVDLERRIRKTRAHWTRVRRMLRARPAARRAPRSDGRQGELSVTEAPGHVVDTVAAIPRGRPIDARTLAGLLQVTPSVAGTRLQRAAKLGLVSRVGRGRYVRST